MQSCRLNHDLLGVCNGAARELVAGAGWTHILKNEDKITRRSIEVGVVADRRPNRDGAVDLLVEAYLAQIEPKIRSRRAARRIARRKFAHDGCGRTFVSILCQAKANAVAQHSRADRARFYARDVRRAKQTIAPQNLRQPGRIHQLRFRARVGNGHLASRRRGIWAPAA